MTSNRISAFPQEMKGLNLSELIKVNQASTEDDPEIPGLPQAFEVVTCTKTITVDFDGNETTVYDLVCYGIGTQVCKCPDTL